MWWIVLVIVIIIAIAIASCYNSLITLKQKVNNSWSQIEVQLQRRFDLIPNLVETVKGYTSHESETLEKITALRTSWANASNSDEKLNLDNELSNTLKSLFAVSESYPELKANENFMSLQNELSDTESKISHSRQFYNDIVTKYNTKIHVFPTNIVAGLFGFKDYNLFQVSSEEVKQNVKVDFNEDK